MAVTWKRVLTGDSQGVGLDFTGQVYPLPNELASNPAKASTSTFQSPQEILRAGYAEGNGLYYINPDGKLGSAKQIYCDFTTRDMKGNTGWMLVASWSTDYNWTQGTGTTDDVLGSSAEDKFSVHFADFQVNDMRIHASSDIDNGGKNASLGDWYYHRDSKIEWKKWWSPASGATGLYPRNTSDNPSSRDGLIGFDYSYHLGFKYQNVDHKSNGLSDQAGSEDFWGQLSTTGGDISNYMASDGSLAWHKTQDGTGQDRHWQSKIGRDDAQTFAYSGSSVDDSYDQASGNSSESTNLWMWVKADDDQSDIKFYGSIHGNLAVKGGESGESYNPVIDFSQNGLDWSDMRMGSQGNEWWMMSNAMRSVSGFTQHGTYKGVGINLYDGDIRFHTGIAVSGTQGAGADMARFNADGTATFNGAITASNLTGSNSGDQTLPTDFVSKASGGTFSGAVSIAQISAVQDGHLTLSSGYQESDYVVVNGASFTGSGNISAGTISGTTGTFSNNLTVNGSQHYFYRATNSGNPEFHMGSSATENLTIQSVFASGAQELAYVSFRTVSTLGATDAGKMTFYVDGSSDAKLSIVDSGIDVIGTGTFTSTVIASGFETDGDLQADGVSDLFTLQVGGTSSFSDGITGTTGTFSGVLSGSNISGTHSGASSNTNTGDVCTTNHTSAGYAQGSFVPVMSGSSTHIFGHSNNGGNPLGLTWTMTGLTSSGQNQSPSNNYGWTYLNAWDRIIDDDSNIGWWGIYHGTASPDPVWFTVEVDKWEKFIFRKYTGYWEWRTNQVNFIISGSLDNANWTVLLDQDTPDKDSNETFDNDSHYRYYKFELANFLDNSPATYDWGLRDFVMYGAYTDYPMYDLIEQDLTDIGNLSGTNSGDVCTTNHTGAGYITATCGGDGHTSHNYATEFSGGGTMTAQLHLNYASPTLRLSRQANTQGAQLLFYDNRGEDYGSWLVGMNLSGADTDEPDFRIRRWTDGDSDCLTLQHNLDAQFYGGLTVNGSISANPDANSSHYFGRVALGSPYSDYASFSHYDMLNGTDYALLQHAGGDTYLNSKSDKSLYFRSGNNSDVGKFTSTTFNCYVGATFSGAITASGTISTSGGYSYFQNSGDNYLSKPHGNNWALKIVNPSADYQGMKIEHNNTYGSGGAGPNGNSALWIEDKRSAGVTSPWAVLKVERSGSNTVGDLVQFESHGAEESSSLGGMWKIADGGTMYVSSQRGGHWVADFHAMNSDHAGVRIRHDSTHGSGGAGGIGNSLLFINDERANNMSSADPTVYIQRDGPNTSGNIFQIDTHSTIAFAVHDNQTSTFYDTVYMETLQSPSGGHLTLGSDYQSSEHVIINGTTFGSGGNGRISTGGDVSMGALTVAGGLTIAGNMTVGANRLIGSNYLTDCIRSIQMGHGGQIMFGDTGATNALGICEGNWNDYTDTDRLSIFCRQDFKIYGYNVDGSNGTELYATFDYQLTTIPVDLDVHGQVYGSSFTTDGDSQVQGEMDAFLLKVQGHANFTGTTSTATFDTKVKLNKGVHTSVHKTWVENIETPNGGDQDCRILEDCYGRWILVGRWASDASASIGTTWSSVRGLETRDDLENVTAFSADWGDAYPSEVRIISADDFADWGNTKGIDFIYKVPRGTKWRYFFSGGQSSGMAFEHARYGWYCDGAYDGKGRWVNHDFEFARMSDGNVTHSTTGFTTPESSAYNWHVASDSKVSVHDTEIYSGQDVSSTQEMGHDDNARQFFDEGIGSVGQGTNRRDYDHQAWVLIKLSDAPAGIGGMKGGSFTTDVYAPNLSGTNTGDSKTTFTLNGGSAQSIQHGETITFTGSGGTTVSQSGNTIDVSSSSGQHSGTFGGDVTLANNLYGTDGNTSEIGQYSDNQIKRIRMCQGGEIHFGDTGTSNALGITEGAWNNFSDQDRLGIYYRNELKMYSNSNVLQTTWDSSGNVDFAGLVTAENFHYSGVVDGHSGQTRDKLRVWSGGTYAIGMKSGYTYGGLGDYAMSFQMNNDSDRGFWWGHSAHTDAQGAMALTAHGLLTVGGGIKVSTETDTSAPTDGFIQGAFKSSGGTSGISDCINFESNNGDSHSVEILDGIIVDWTVVS